MSKSDRISIPFYLMEPQPNEAIDTIISELFYRQQDARHSKVFQALCLYAQKKNLAQLNFDPLSQFIYEKGQTGISTAINLKTTLTEVIQTLEKNGYASFSLSADSEKIESLTLMDPTYGKIKQNLAEAYSFENIQTQVSPPIVTVGHFPNLTSLTTRFNLSPEQVQALFLNVNETEFSQVFFDTHPNQLLQVLFQDGSSKPFDIVLCTEFNLALIAKHAAQLIIQFTANNSRYADEIRSRLKQIPEMNKYSLESVIQDLQSTSEITPEAKFLNWAAANDNVAGSAEFKSHPERFINTAIDETTTSLKFAYIIQATTFFHHFLLNTRESLKQKQWATEAEAQDRKNIITFLIQAARRQVSMPSASGQESYESIFVPVTLESLLTLKDSSGKMTLGEKYSEERFIQMLRVENNESVPLIIRLGVEGETYFFHRFRLIDVVYAELSNERFRIKKKLAQQWAKLEVSEIPKKKLVTVSESQLSPFFHELYVYTLRVLDGYPTISEMVNLLFPRPEDISTYKLSNSDLAYTEEELKKSDKDKVRATPSERAEFFREIFFNTAYSLDRKNLWNILALDYDEILKESKNVRSQLASQSGNSKLTGLIDKSLYSFINGVVTFFVKIFESLQSLFGQPTTPSKATSTPSSKQSVELHFPKIPYSDISEKFNCPPSYQDLHIRLERSLHDWNQVYIDPKTYYPDWSKYSLEEKENLKIKLEKETSDRMSDSQKRVDKAIEKKIKTLNLSITDATLLQDISKDLAKQFRNNNLEPLASYIHDKLILLASEA